MNVARFVVDHPDGLVVGRQHYEQGTVVAFTAWASCTTRSRAGCGRGTSATCHAGPQGSWTARRSGWAGTRRG
jgi:hypothetical protein